MRSHCRWPSGKRPFFHWATGSTQMSASFPKAHVGGGQQHICQWPLANIAAVIGSRRRRAQEATAGR